jgi:glucose-1-phosphate thymidylyltransferase
MKGIVLAGGAGTRLHPVALVVSKRLMPVFDMPIVHYPLSVLMLVSISGVMQFSTPHGLQERLGEARAETPAGGVTVFAYRVEDPECYGLVKFDTSGRALTIAEKPKASRSNWTVTGLNFHDGRAPSIAQALDRQPRTDRLAHVLH